MTAELEHAPVVDLTPRDGDLERLLLGQALWDPTVVETAHAAGLTAATFHSPAHVTIWSTICALRNAGADINAITVKSELDARKALSPASVRSLGTDPGTYIAQLALDVPSAENAAWTANRLIRLQRLRDIQAAGARLVQRATSADADPSDLEQIARDILDAGLPTVDLIPSWRPVDLSTYLDGTYEPEKASITPRVDGHHLFYAGRVHSLHGESESGKSLVAQAALALELQADHDVLYVDWESDAATIVGRLTLMGVAPSSIAEHLTYIRPETAPHGHLERAEWDALLARRFTIAVLDGVTDALGTMGATTKDNDEIAAWMRVLPRPLAERTGAATLMIDHVTKDADTRGRYAVGGQAKMNGLDGAAYVVEMTEPIGRGLAGIVTLRIGKDRPGDIRPHCGRWRASDRTQEATRVHVDSTEGPIKVTFDGPSSHVTDGPSTDPDAPAFRPTGLMEKVSRFLESSDEEWSRKELAKALRGAGSKGSQATILDAIGTLVDEGYLATRDAPRGAKPVTLARSYRQRMDPLSDNYEEPVPGWDTEPDRAVRTDTATDTEQVEASDTHTRLPRRGGVSVSGTAQTGPAIRDDDPHATSPCPSCKRATENRTLELHEGLCTTCRYSPDRLPEPADLDPEGPS